MTVTASLVLIGRVVFGLFFLIAALRNFAAFDDKIPSRTNYGWTNPPAVVAIGFAAQLVGGLSLIFGLYPAWGAVLLIAFLVLATALYHNLFRFSDKERDPHLYLALVNTTLAAGLLMIIGLSL